MRARLEHYICFAAVLCVAGCGGASSSLPAPSVTSPPGGGPPGPSSSPSPQPTTTPGVSSFSGTLTQTFTVYGTPAPSPSTGATPIPTATPWVSTNTENISQKITVTNGASFNGQAGLNDYVTNEIDTGPRSTTSLVSNTYIAMVPDPIRVNGTAVTEVGSQSTDSDGVTYITTFASPNEIVSKTPLVPGEQWNNTAARTETENDPDAETLTTTYAPSGTYAEQMTYPEGGTGKAFVNADGSAVYQAPLFGEDASNSSITVDAPLDDQIKVAYLILEPPLPLSGSFEVPVWYASVPPVLASDSFEVLGVAQPPSPCNVPAQYASVPVQEVSEQQTRLDPLFGETESETTVSYISNQFGVLCTVTNDDLKTYYDYSGQSQGIIVASNTPLEEATVSETIGISSGSLPSASGVASTHAFASFDRFKMLVARERLRKARVMLRNIRRGSAR